MTRLPILREGQTDPCVAQIRHELTRIGSETPPAGPSEHFDDTLAGAIRGFQQQRGLLVDGIVGPQTWAWLAGAGYRLGDRSIAFDPELETSGQDVAELQQKLMALGFPLSRTDGVFGADTDRSLRLFQRAVGIAPDGVVGPATLRAFGGLSRAVSGGSPQELRESEQVDRTGGSLRGLTVVLDAGHALASDAPRDPASAWLIHELTELVAQRLRGLGVEVVFTHEPAHWPSDRERAAVANRIGADVALSLYCDRSDNPDANGVATFYYGEGRYGAWSPVGERLADLVLREIVARTGLTDGRHHAVTWPFLHRTLMPAVRIDVGYVTNARDEARLLDPSFRSAVAEAIVVGLQRVYLGEADLSATGTFHFDQLRELA